MSPPSPTSGTSWPCCGGGMSWTSSPISTWRTPASGPSTSSAPGETAGVVKESVEGVLHGEAGRLFTDDRLRVRAESWSVVATGIDDRLRAEVGGRDLL